MKLQKRFLREVKGKKYYKYLIQISPKDVKKAGLKDNDNLNIVVKNRELRVRKLK